MSLNILVIAQYLIAALSSAFNAGYFLTYRSPKKRRRVGAVALALVNLAVFVESSYFGLVVFFQRQQWSGAFFLEPRYWLAARLLLSLGLVSISALVLRQLALTRKR